MDSVFLKNIFCMSQKLLPFELGAAVYQALLGITEDQGMKISLC